jgi:hypothetical protein
MKTHKKNSIRKLSIGKETISSLNQLHLNKIIGGYVNQPTTCYNQPTNSVACPTWCCG